MSGKTKSTDTSGESKAPEVVEKAQGLVSKVMKWRPVRVWMYFNSNGGNLFANGLTYQAIFALFAAIFVGVSVLGLVLAGNPVLQQQVLDSVGSSVPGLFGEDGVIKPSTLQSVMNPGAFGWSMAIGLVGTFLTAIGYLASTREALRRLFAVPHQLDNINPVMLKLRDAGLAVLFGVAMVISAGLTLASGSALTLLYDLVGIPTDSPIAQVIGKAIGVLLVFGFDMVVLAAIYRWLSALKIPAGPLWQGAALGAVGLGIIKIFGNLLIGGASKNPFLASFAVFIGVLIWFNFMCKVQLIGASYIKVVLDERGIKPVDMSVDDARRLSADAAREAQEARIDYEMLLLEDQLHQTPRWRRGKKRRRLEVLRAEKQRFVNERVFGDADDVADSHEPPSKRHAGREKREVDSTRDGSV